MEDEWRARPEFVHAAKGVARTAVVDLNQPGQTWARNCPYGSRTPVLSLIPSDDYARATLDLDRGDLRWATITTPPEHHDKTAGLWRPEICIALEGCTGIQAGRPLWLYIPAREAFVRVEQTTLEAGNLTFFATRPGDTYIQ